MITSDPGDLVFVQAVGCDATVAHPCPAPGARTEVLWKTFAALPGGVFEDSRLILGPGADVRFCAHDSAEVVVKGATDARIWVGDPRGPCFDTPSFPSAVSITVDSGSASLELRSGTTRIRGGTVDLRLRDLVNLAVEGDAHVLIEGGVVGLDADAGDSIEVRGGTLQGGVFGPVIQLANAVMDLHGGVIAAPVKVGGGSFPGEGWLRVHGVGFEIDGVPQPFDTILFGPGLSGRLTGTLESGEPIDQDIVIDPIVGVLSFTEATPPPVPALPSGGLALLGLGLAAAAGIALRTSRRRAR